MQMLAPNVSFAAIDFAFACQQDRQLRKCEKKDKIDLHVIGDKQHECYHVLAWDGTHFKTHRFEYPEYPSFFVCVENVENADAVFDRFSADHKTNKNP